MTEASLSDKVVLITGGARRIGAVVCRVLHAQGARVMVHYRSSKSEVDALRRELEDIRPGSVDVAQADLLDADAPERLVEATLSSFGRLDVLVNNASSFYPTPIGGATLGNWRDLMGTNLRVPFFLSQAAAPHLRQRSGTIVSIADIHAERPMKEHTIYSVAKAGLVMLTKSLARELAPEVRVNAIAPGAILWPERVIGDTDRDQILSATPLQRIGQPEDIAATVLFLVRDAHYVTGQVIAVCGGRSITL
jgi:pteridine reductase